MPDSRDTDAQVAERVMGLDVRGKCLACDHDDGWSVDYGGFWDDSTMQPVYLAAPHWDVAQGYEPDPDEVLVNGASKYGLCVVDFYTTDPTADYAVLCRVRETREGEQRRMFDYHLYSILRRRDAACDFLALMATYEPGDFSRAALSVLTPTKEQQ